MIEKYQLLNLDGSITEIKYNKVPKSKGTNFTLLKDSTGQPFTGVLGAEDFTLMEDSDDYSSMSISLPATAALRHVEVFEDDTGRVQVIWHRANQLKENASDE